MTVTAAREPVEFEAALRGFGDRYWHRHPFHERLHAGNLREDELRLWVANRWYYQKSLPQKDAAIVANCPVGEVRRRWLNRIVYQDGPADGEVGLASWLDLAEATGLSRAEVLDERHVVPGVRFATDAYVTFARTRPWEEAVAASLTEIFSPDLMRNRVEALRTHYAWVEPGGHHYFHSRADQARKDADYALEVVLRECTSRLQQDAALAALSFKCDMLWAMLDTIEHATRRLTRRRPFPVPVQWPRLRPGVRLAPDPAAGDEALLFPEGVVLLDESAGAVLHRCDGVASVERIIRGLGREYEGVAPEDVQAVLRWLAERRLLEVDGG